jgi:carbon dioxide concentrating mechanism protein CcmM
MRDVTNTRLSRRDLLLGGSGLALGAVGGFGIAELAGDGDVAPTGEPLAPTLEQGGNKLESGVVIYADGTTYVSPLVEVFGDVTVGSGVFVASNTVLRAAPGQTVTIGDATNAQDNVIIRALRSSTSVKSRTSLAHHSVVRDSEVGDFVFLGFRAEVREAKIGHGAVVLHGARVFGVEIPRNALVEPGATVASQPEANSLPKVEEALVEFKNHVVEVNAELAESYVELAREATYEQLTIAGPNPVTSFNPRRTAPEVGAGTELLDFARLVGDVRLGANSRVGERAAIRADEGSPIVIGEEADIGSRVTFHALKETSIEVGDRFRVSGDSVIHGPLEVGSEVTVGIDAVVFQARVGDAVRIGDRAVIAGPQAEDEALVIPNGTVIPSGAVVTTQKDVEALASRAR